MEWKHALDILVVRRAREIFRSGLARLYECVDCLNIVHKRDYGTGEDQNETDQGEGADGVKPEEDVGARAEHV